MTRRVGSRELKAKLSTYLARARAGESFVVTDYGSPVARLVPLHSDPLLDELIASGRLSWSRRPVQRPREPVCPRGGSLVPRRSA